jgi:predicted double-glycine peptidase
MLALKGHIYSPQELEVVLEPTEDLGTLPAAIETTLTQLGLSYQIKQGKFQSLNPTHLPILVNMNHENDGDHYMVVTAIDEDENLTLMDPYYGELKYYSYRAFKQVWYSPLKKLRNWSLYLT